MNRLFRIFLVFVKIGAFTVGGGYAMLPLIQKELVENQKWLTNEDMLDILSVSQSLPGIIAVNTAILTGYRTAKHKGAMIAAIGVIIPSFFIILLVAMFLADKVDKLEVFFNGVKAGIAALMLMSAVNIIKGAVKAKLDFIIFLVAFVLVSIFNVNPIYVIVSGLVYGYVMSIREYRKNTKEV